MPTKIEINKKLLTELYSVKQLSVGKISQRLGYSQTCIYDNLKRWQIPIISNSQRYKGKPGRPHTKEARKELALSKMGDKNPMKRLEVRLKVSKKNKGRKYSNDIRARMSKAQKGRTITCGIPKYKVVVQCDGDWWHGNPNIYNQSNLAKIPQNNMRRDNLQDFQLHEEGWHVIRFWESDIKDNVAHCVDKVENFIKKKQGV